MGWLTKTSRKVSCKASEPVSAFATNPGSLSVSPIEPDADGIPKPDVANPYYGPSDINWGFRFSYRKRIWDNKVNWRLQLNLSNVFSDERDLIPVRVNDNGTIAQSRTSAPKGWVLSSRFD